jgi:alkylation response protein AidB-like acyl-CoA dehydrogenase
MQIALTPVDAAFRDEVRHFIADALTPELREAGARCTGIYNDYRAANAWHRILAARGWSVPAWPLEQGGTGWTPIQHHIFESEMALAQAPRITPNAIRMVAPVLMAFGTDAQKERYLPAIRSGDDWWAQGYSEPGSGSDLASLSCRAARDGDDYVINGSKIWTTHAHFSNRIFCLVRTAKLAKPQQGISFLLFDLDVPGISIRPIISISGDHELNEIFFEDVRVPASSLLGEENDGWTVAKYLLQHERTHAWSPLLRARLRRMRERPMAGIGSFRHRLAAAEIRLVALEVMEHRLLTGDAGALAPSAVPSMLKILGTELRQQLTELAIELEGPAAIALPGSGDPALWDFWQGADAMAIYLNDRAASIYAGTNEVQRNIIAGALLRAK